MSSNRKNIILIGGGGHCKSCIEIINSTGKYHIAGILDLPSELGKKILGVKVIGNDDDYLKFHEQGNVFFITVGQIKNAELRKRIFRKLTAIGAQIETIIAPTAYVSETAKIGEGSIVMHKTFLNSGVKIGSNNIINTGAILEHDVTIGNHNHISTGTIINGDSTIGDENFIGSGANIANNINIGNQTVIGSGTVVINNIDNSGVYVGNPVRKIE
ncbi:NeuD/PglB/VioB family sugar acetyltransferase [Chryseobacterium echinoideorum]|uniref:NeuD/PglB/VioB family sugar acetyltransferase n=1 Tax=Chryseobacterium echinoideorum TaxID=1549648 RepID=UPI0011862323|nr:NeuD/PglB/VioB family sugar acetyltransferase [Chryseobacterium echinoideorum]